MCPVNVSDASLRAGRKEKSGNKSTSHNNRSCYYPVNHPVKRFCRWMLDVWAGGLSIVHTEYSVRFSYFSPAPNVLVSRSRPLGASTLLLVVAVALSIYSYYQSTGYPSVLIKMKRATISSVWLHVRLSEMRCGGRNRLYPVKHPSIQPSLYPILQ